MRNKTILTYAIIFLLTTLGNTFAQKNVIEVKVSKNKVETDEIFTYSIKIEGEFSSPKLIFPEFKNFQIAAQSQSKNYSLKTGKTQLTVQIQYQLFADRPGTFTIGEVILKDKGKAFKSSVITIEVRGKPLQDKKKIIPYLDKGINI